MDLITFFTPSHKELADNYLLNSEVSDFNIKVFSSPQKCLSAIYYEEGWFDTVEAKIECIIKYMKNTNEKYFIFSDPDVIVCKKSSDYFLEKIQNSNKDGLFQYDFEARYCTGFFILKISNEIIDLFQEVILKIKTDHIGDQKAFNNSIKNTSLKFDYLSINEVASVRCFANCSKNLSDIEINNLDIQDYNFRVFHANWTKGIKNKNNLLDKVNKKII